MKLFPFLPRLNSCSPLPSCRCSVFVLGGGGEGGPVTAFIWPAAWQPLCPLTLRLSVETGGRAETEGSETEKVRHTHTHTLRHRGTESLGTRT